MTAVDIWAHTQPQQNVIQMASITDYFKKNKKGETLQHINQEKKLSSSEQFYRMSLAQQKLKCKNTSCIEIILELESQVKDIEIKIQNTKDAIVTCQSIISEKDCKIEALEKKMASINVTSDSVATNNHDADSDLNSVLIFEEFSSDFNSTQLADLRKVGKEKREDSKFISVALRSLYDKKLETLETKSITGKSSKPGQQKEKITPKKIAILGKIFQSRIQDATADPTERVMREKRLNKLIKDAQSNITKALKNQRIEKEVGRRLTSFENCNSD